LKKYLILLYANIKKDFIIWKRYLSNSVIGLTTLYITFRLVVRGYSSIAGGTPADFGSTLEGILVGFLLSYFALMTYSDISKKTLTEAREGTLEQLYMSPFGYGMVAAFKLISSFLINIIFITVLLIAILLTTDKTLNFDIILISPLLILTLLGVSSLGFITGGLTLVFKRVSSYKQIVQFIVIGLIAAPPIDTYPLFRYLPASKGSWMIRRIMIRDIVVTGFPLSDFLFLALNSLFYLTLGYIIFKLCEKRAMKKGMLGHY